MVTLGSGQMSSYYGDACDLVISQEYVTPVGDLKTLDFPATTNGPSVDRMMIASAEGEKRFAGNVKRCVKRICRHLGSMYLSGYPTHHHGIGKLFSPWMQPHLGDAQMAVLRALKRHFDPNTIMNPGGQLGLDWNDRHWRDIC